MSPLCDTGNMNNMGVHHRGKNSPYFGVRHTSVFLPSRPTCSCYCEERELIFRTPIQASKVRSYRLGHQPRKRILCHECVFLTGRVTSPVCAFGTNVQPASHVRHMPLDADAWLAHSGCECSCIFAPMSWTHIHALNVSSSQQPPCKGYERS